MSRMRIIYSIVIVLIMLAGCTPAKTKSNKVLLVLSETSQDMDYMLENEIGVDVDMLKKAGSEPVLASRTGVALGTSQIITPDLKLADVKVEDYVGVMFPCMATAWIYPYYPEPLRVAQQAAALKKPIAAQVHGIFTLIEAGVMDGKKYTLIEELKDTVYAPTSIYMGEGIVQDGNIITSGICPFMARETGKPDGTKELAQKFIDYLKSTP